jgi:hypothetical protein
MFLVKLTVLISLCGCRVNLLPDWITCEVFEDEQLDAPAKQPEISSPMRDEVKERVINSSSIALWLHRFDSAFRCNNKC